MNIQYLKEFIIPQREKEIREGKNLCTAQPIYVVLDLIDCICSEHDEFSPTTNYKGKYKEYGYVDMALEPEAREFKTSYKDMTKPHKITRFFIDRIKAFFLTSKAAHEYMDYQSHNLTDPYVFVFHSGYGNREMDQLLNGK